MNEWLIRAKEFNIPELNTFVNGIKRDIESVKNSLIISYSNGLLEGIINKIKEIKRTSYGRCKFDLLRIKTFNYQEVFGKSVNQFPRFSRVALLSPNMQENQFSVDKYSCNVDFNKRITMQYFCYFNPF